MIQKITHYIGDGRTAAGEPCPVHLVLVDDLPCHDCGQMLRRGMRCTWQHVPELGSVRPCCPICRPYIFLKGVYEGPHPF